MGSRLRLAKVSAGYGKSQVLFDVSMNVEPGSICAVLGPNGSGKSSLLKTVFGLTRVYDGQIEFNETVISGRKPYEIARLGVAYLPQVDNLYLNLNVRENLLMAGYTLTKDESVKRADDVLGIFPNMKEFLEKKTLTLSGGERQMVVMATALMREPSLMMFDEPSANLSPKIASQIFDKIKELNRELGVSVVLVEQNTKRALELSNEAYLLVSGRVNFHGPSNELAANEEFGRLFLGV